MIIYKNIRLFFVFELNAVRIMTREKAKFWVNFGIEIKITIDVW